MAFSSTITERPKSMGGMRMSQGSWADTGGVTTGNINTGLRKCHSLMLTPTGTGTEAKAAVINETLPCDGSAVTIVFSATDAGYWLAFGY